MFGLEIFATCFANEKDVRILRPTGLRRDSKISTRSFYDFIGI